MPCRLRYPLSFAAANLNSPQETGSMRTSFAADHAFCENHRRFHRSRAVQPPVRYRPSFFYGPGFSRRSGSAPQRTRGAVVLTAPHTTVVVFADHPLPKSEWPSLFAAIRSVLAEFASTKTHVVDINAELVQGDALVPGLRVDASLSVYLHGDCNAQLQPPRGYPAGATLGWVWQRQGTIEPFVHVDCTSIGQMLEPGIYWFSKEQRVHAMAGAIARVIVHEWIHIATQSAGHSAHGVTKAHFGIDDLLPERDRFLARLRSSR